LLKTVLLMGLLGAGSGCTHLPDHGQRLDTRAWSTPQDTRIGRSVQPYIDAHPGDSGFYLLGNGLDAYMARMMMIEAAEHSLDVQYYVLHNDDTGLLILSRLLAAADRGVRVRLLLDDLYSQEIDAEIHGLDQHANIEVRLFNPFAYRTWRTLNFLTDFRRVNHRMHNKSMTADNAVTLVGGRNLGDEYFEAAEDLNFTDLDLLSIGPVVDEVSTQFDRYWNHPVVYDLETLSPARGPDALRAVRVALAAHEQQMRGSPYIRRLGQSSLSSLLRDDPGQLYWGQAHVLYDQPHKMRADSFTESDALSAGLRPYLLEAVAPPWMPRRSLMSVQRTTSPLARWLVSSRSASAANCLPACQRRPVPAPK
jgi:putative cardiolipin synthase